MDKKYIRYAVYILIIFISIVIIGNLSVFVYKDSVPNSLDFSKVQNSTYKQDVSESGLIKLFLEERMRELIALKYENTYNALTTQSRQRLFSTIDEFKKVISEKYVNVYSTVRIEYAGYNKKLEAYIYDIYLMGPPYLEDEELAKLEVYKDKMINVAVYADKNNNYTIDFDI